MGLDVYNGEPNIHPEYLTLPNVFVLPHLGSATIKTRTAMGDLAINNVDEFFKTGKCVNCVNWNWEDCKQCKLDSIPNCIYFFLYLLSPFIKVLSLDLERL